MKKILITGLTSYIGNSLEQWLKKDSENYIVDKISLRDDKWKNKDFSSYDSIIHAVGIAHVSSDPKMEKEYYKINTDLTIEVAKKAKRENVKQFIFLSSIIIYGDSKLEDSKITQETVPNPSNFYGNSKLLAEQALSELTSDDFNIVIVRPPMIYGKNSKGNYLKLAKLAKKIPIFPDFPNQRSMLYIENLCEFLKCVVDFNSSGIYYPQNKEYVNTSNLVKTISYIHQKNIILTKVFNPIIKLLFNFNAVNKVFGNLVYDKKMSQYDFDYQVINFEKSIEMTEGE